MSSIQFSYPQMNGTLDETNKKIAIDNNGGSYFDLTYTVGGTTTVLHFIPKIISFMDGETDYMIIEHNNNSGKTLKIRFKISQSSGASEITVNNIYIDKLIGDGLEDKTLNFTEKSLNVGLSNTKEYTIDFSICGSIPIKTVDEKFKGGTFVSDAANIIKDGITNISIPLTATTFMTDEIVCDEGTNNSTNNSTNTTKTYEGKVAGNVGLSFGIGLLILTLVVWGVTSLNFKYKVNTGLFDWGMDFDQKAYTVIFILMFLLSVSCFMAYGGVLTWGGLLEGETPEQRDTKLTALLSTAIISLLIFVFMVGYKMIVMTEKTAVANL
jgi:hypothetical protein